MIATRDSAARQMLANVVVTVLIAGVTDATLRSLGWNQPRGEAWPAFAPRGATIGLIWVVLFAGMGAARALVMRSVQPDSARDATMIAGLIVACLAYPFYTHFLHGHITELLGNIVTFVFALTIVVRVRHHSRLAAALIALVAVWIAFATVLVVALVQLNGWQTIP